MTGEQRRRYAVAIRQVLETNPDRAISPDVLFKAADLAVSSEASNTEAHVGLQPGTMNPVHYGHLSASLAAIVANTMDGVLLMNGGNVPDKPHAANAEVRYEMLRLAVGENGLGDWLWATPIRQQVVEMFSQDPPILHQLGRDDSARRSTMDLAAFIWLFRANPKIKWTFIVGSDKVASYGKKKECDLIVKTLGDPRAKARVLYFERERDAVDVERDISPYDWMLAKWRAGFFEKSRLPSCQISASRVRAAIATGDREVADALPPSVLAFIHGNEDLLSSYIRETPK